MIQWLTIHNGDFEADINLDVATGLTRGEKPGANLAEICPVTLFQWRKLMKLLSSDPLLRNEAAIYKLPHQLDGILNQFNDNLKAVVKNFSEHWKDPEYYYNHGGDKKKKAEIKRTNAYLKSAVTHAKADKERVEKMILIFHENTDTAI